MNPNSLLPQQPMKTDRLDDDRAFDVVGRDSYGNALVYKKHDMAGDLLDDQPVESKPVAQSVPPWADQVRRRGVDKPEGTETETAEADKWLEGRLKSVAARLGVQAVQEATVLPDTSAKAEVSEKALQQPDEVDFDLSDARYTQSVFAKRGSKATQISEDVDLSVVVDPTADAERVRREAEAVDQIGKGPTRHTGSSKKPAGETMWESAKRRKVYE